MSAHKSKILTGIPYGSHPLQTYNVTILDPSPAPAKLWIIFIHGGAWHDPLITSSSFEPAAAILQTHPQIVALASLNYRLSPHAKYPDSGNIARHPDHINDILAAIASLQATYGFGNRYVLAGHSAGATLALQTAMSRSWGAGSATPVVPPLAVLGVEGIYDITLLLETYAHPAYREFIVDAFGDEERTWREASPALGKWEAGHGTALVVLAHSREDELVGWEQVDAMEQRLKLDGFGAVEGAEKCYQVVHINGTHDQIWEEGTQLAKAVEVCCARTMTLLWGEK